MPIHQSIFNSCFLVCSRSQGSNPAVVGWRQVDTPDTWSVDRIQVPKSPQAHVFGRMLEIVDRTRRFCTATTATLWHGTHLTSAFYYEATAPWSESKNTKSHFQCKLIAGPTPGGSKLTPSHPRLLSDRLTGFIGWCKNKGRRETLANVAPTRSAVVKWAPSVYSFIFHPAAFA